SCTATTRTPNDTAAPNRHRRLRRTPSLLLRPPRHHGMGRHMPAERRRRRAPRVLERPPLARGRPMGVVGRRPHRAPGQGRRRGLRRLPECPVRGERLMARSVSYATGSAWVLYAAPGHDDDRECPDCEGEGRGGVNTTDGGPDDDCSTCSGEGTIYDEDLARIYWDDFVGNLRAEFEAAFPSLYEADEWVGREDYAILQTGHAYIGLSEYCGLVSLWCLPKDERYRYEPTPLAVRWCESIED